MKASAFEYTRAEDAAAAVRLLGQAGPDAKLIAGGQSLGPMLNLRVARPAKLIDIRRCPDLSQIKDDGDAILYGAAVTHAAFEDTRADDATPGWLAPIARGIAYRAVRNRGTIGGSLAHADPAADWPSALLALGASIRIQGAHGVREAALDAFTTGPFTVDLRPDEIIIGVRVPKRGQSAQWGYWKFCRKIGEFAKAIGCVLHDPDRGETRAVIGAAERPPILVHGAAELLEDPDSADAIIARNLPDLSPAGKRLHAEALARAARIAKGQTP